MSQRPSTYFPALTGLRALLAWDVFLFHYGESDHPLMQAFIAGGGEVGVSLFFLLSGFLIAFQYETSTDLNKRFLAPYFFRRWTRIYPLFFVVSVISILLLWWHGDRKDIDVAHLFLHFTLLKGFFQEHVFSFIGPAWSLTVEECFYAAAPFIFLLRKKMGLMVQCLIIAVVGMLLVWAGKTAGSTDFMHEYSFMFYWTFFGRAFQFCCGIALAGYLRRRPVQEIRRRFSVLTVASVAALLTAQCCLYPLHKVSFYGSPDVLAIAFNNLVIPLIGTALLYGLIAGRSLISKLLSGRAFAMLGRSSFAFYLVHLSPLILLPKRYYQWPPLVSFGVAVGVSVVLFLLVENPLHRALNGWWKQVRS